MKLSECIDKYINENKEYLKERTVISYKNRKEKIIELIGDLDIDLITQDFLQSKILEWQFCRLACLVNNLFFDCQLLQTFQCLDFHLFY